MFEKGTPGYKVLIVSAILSFLGGVSGLLIDSGLGMDSSTLGNFGLYLGLSALAIGLIEIPVGIVFAIIGKGEYAKAFLISAGIMLLLSGISCGGALAFGNI